MPSFPWASPPTASGTGGRVIGPDYLPISVPFAVSEHATALEIYLYGLRYAFDPSPVAGLTCSTTPGPESAQDAKTLSDVSGK